MNKITIIYIKVLQIFPLLGMLKFLQGSAKIPDDVHIN